MLCRREGPNPTGPVTQAQLAAVAGGGATKQRRRKLNRAIWALRESEAYAAEQELRAA